MESGIMQQERDLVLPPNTFAFVLDRTKGKVMAYVGPFKSSLSQTDSLVTWRDGKFVPTPEHHLGTQSFVEAEEGQYVVLTNPAHENPEEFPRAGTANDTVALDTGRKVVIPGPTSFPLWPGQSAQVIDGHHLRHNQYLVVRVYEPEAAKNNAERALVAPQTTQESESTPTLDSNFTMGQLIVIRGTDVSFYVPPTGIEVVPEQPGRFIRDAATLEQLEYCVLLDENGNKRFEQGPAVIFPKPTETFATDDEGSRKFRAIELNPQSGLYIKVIAPYEEDGREYKEGEELFLTGANSPIYFPRVEHSIIQYGDKRKHHAIAIPEGEGRYILDRTTGEVSLVRGPKMFLPDPRSEVIVRRILAPKLVEVMYPGNNEALEVNRALEEEKAERTKLSRQAGGLRGQGHVAAAAVADVMETEDVSYKSLSATPTHTFGGEKMRRGTEYTPPRTITLETKYEGAVTVSPWPGYAVLVMDKSGNRRVETGPVNILLDYDESLMILSLSTGRPKSDHQKLRTPYLRTINNSVSDRVTVETRDLVPVTLDLALRVNFEGENRTRWFDVEDYVALLTDHCRSKLRNLAKRHDIQVFYTQTIDLIRDALLGPSEDGERTGLSFEENGMRLYDVEVLDVRIDHAQVEQLLSSAMDSALRGAIEVSETKRVTEQDAEIQRFARQRLAQQEETRKVESGAEIAKLERQRQRDERNAENRLAAVAEQARVTAVERAEEEANQAQMLAFTQKQDDIELSRLHREVEEMVARANALDPKLADAISKFGDQSFVEKMMEAIGPVALTTGVTTADTFHQIFKGTPFEGITEALSERPYAIGNGGRRGSVEE